MKCDWLSVDYIHFSVQHGPVPLINRTQPDSLNPPAAYLLVRINGFKYVLTRIINTEENEKKHLKLTSHNEVA